MWSWIRRQVEGSGRRIARSPGPGVEQAQAVVWRLSGEVHEAGSAPIVAEVVGAHSFETEAARRWHKRQSYRPLWLVYRRAGTEEMVALDPESRPRSITETPVTRWRALVTGLPDWPETHLESAFLVAASERVDAVLLAPYDDSSSGSPRPWLQLFLADRFSLEPRSGALLARRPGLLFKRIPASDRGVTEIGSPPQGLFRCGPYESDSPLPSPLVVDVLDAASIQRRGPSATRARILVLAPFLARGGAEHTLFETCRVLNRSDQFDFAFATVAPHRRELGDRRADFRTISPLLYSLGELLHPDAMYGALLSLVDSLDIQLLYNANGSTLFYDFARRLRADRPGLPILDHLYDHAVGYITWYDSDTPQVVDICIAENRRIADLLVNERGWDPARVPVVWPCGRRSEAFPDLAERGATRARLRAELGIADDELLLLTAARVHPQKRPLDWVRLGEGLAGARTRLVWVGGGELEVTLDGAIADSPATNLMRLPFRDDIPALLLAADVALLVSEFEGLPVFLLEALQAGRPFLATDVGDIRDLAQSTGAGFVTGPPGDLPALVEGAMRLRDAELRNKLADNATASGPGFGVEACAARYGDVFRRALEPK